MDEQTAKSSKMPSHEADSSPADAVTEDTNSQPTVAPRRKAVILPTLSKDCFVCERTPSPSRFEGPPRYIFFDPSLGLEPHRITREDFGAAHSPPPETYSPSKDSDCNLKEARQDTNSEGYRPTRTRRKKGALKRNEPETDNSAPVKLCRVTAPTENSSEDSAEGSIEESIEDSIEGSTEASSEDSTENSGKRRLEMAKPKVDMDEKHYVSQKAIKKDMTINNCQFKLLLEAINTFIHEHKEECKKTPRVWTKPNWKELARTFIYGEENGPKYWDKERPGVDAKYCLNYPDDQEDIEFLTFCLLKLESAKQCSATRKKRESADTSTLDADNSDGSADLKAPSAKVSKTQESQNVISTLSSGSPGHSPPLTQGWSSSPIARTSNPTNVAGNSSNHGSSDEREWSVVEQGSTECPSISPGGVTTIKKAYPLENQMLFYGGETPSAAVFQTAASPRVESTDHILPASENLPGSRNQSLHAEAAENSPRDNDPFSFYAFGSLQPSRTTDNEASDETVVVFEGVPKDPYSCSFPYPANGRLTSDPSNFMASGSIEKHSKSHRALDCHTSDHGNFTASSNIENNSASRSAAGFQSTFPIPNIAKAIETRILPPPAPNNTRTSAPVPYRQPGGFNVPDYGADFNRSLSLSAANWAGDRSITGHYAPYSGPATARAMNHSQGWPGFMEYPFYSGYSQDQGFHGPGSFSDMETPTWQSQYADYRSYSDWMHNLGNNNETRTGYVVENENFTSGQADLGVDESFNTYGWCAGP